MATVAIVSDTHLPRGRRELGDELLRRCAEADLVVHLGDLVTLDVLRALEALGPPVHAVAGNVDDPAVRAELPERLELEVGDVRFGLLHDAGPASGRLDRMRKAFPGCRAVLFGHSHIPLHASQDGGDGRFDLFNPGSAVERRRQPTRTMGLAHVSGGDVDFAHLDLGP